MGKSALTFDNNKVYATLILQSVWMQKGVMK